MQAAQGVPVTYKCQRCGRQSPVETAFVIKKRADGSLARCVCFECAHKRASRSDALIYILFPLAGLLLLLLDPGSGLGHFFLLVCACLLVSIPLTVLHELSHALAARALGFRVFAIHLGLGKALFTQRVFGINWTVHLVPSSGVTLVSGPEMPNTRARIFLIHLAGPLFHMILNALLVWSGSVFGLYGYWYAVIQWTNTFMLILNLIPHKGQVAVGIAGTDGWAMLKAPRLTPEDLRARYASFYALETISAVESGETQAAIAFAEEGITRYPDDASMRNVLGYAYINSREFLKSRQIFQQALHSNENLPIATRAILLNNVAFANLMLDDPALLQQADEYSNQAFQILSWEPAIIGTRGSVLVALGQVGQGIELLKTALNKTPDKKGKALDACLIAWGEWKRGAAKDSEAYLALARRLDPDCFLIDHVREKIRSGL